MSFRLIPVAAAAALCLCASAFAGTDLLAGHTSGMDPTTGNTSAPSNWRFAPGQLFNGVPVLDATASLSYTDAEGSWACSGTLLQGGQYVLTAAHCAESFTSMTVEFQYYAGSASVTRTVAVGDGYVHPLWQGWNLSADRGIDLAILKLNAPVTTIQGVALSSTNDVGKTMLVAGYGTSTNGNTTTAPNWNDGAYGHYGYNVADVTSKDFDYWADQAIGWGHNPAYFIASTYMFDFDGVNGTTAYNTLGRIAAVTGNNWVSDAGLGANEALIAGGDSGGGDFVWTGTEWQLSGVHSWGWQGGSACSYFGLTGCDRSSGNSSSYGDLSGSTAVFDNLTWINSVVAVPEPGTLAMWLAGLAVMGGAARRRRVS